MTSGMKQCVKVKTCSDTSTTVEQIQKRILIYDLQNLYKNWIKDFDLTTVPCLAFFSKLRPKQCVFADGPGTHNVCVCQIHQNVKLKLCGLVDILNHDINYKELIEVSVCSVEEKNCMLRKCDQCPKETGVRKFLNASIGTKNISSVDYNQWTSVKSNNSSTVRVSLLEFSELLDKFVDNLCKDV